MAPPAQPPLAGSSAASNSVLGYVLDFYCAEARLAVELDGGQHAMEPRRSYDATRSRRLDAAGIRVLRFWNDVVLTETDAVLEQIAEALARSPSPLPAPPEGERGR